jgi:hypothetical protein
LERRVDDFENFGFRFRFLVVVFFVFGFGFSGLVLGLWVQGSGFRVQGSAFKANNVNQGGRVPHGNFKRHVKIMKKITQNQTKPKSVRKSRCPYGFTNHRVLWMIH